MHNINFRQLGKLAREQLEPCIPFVRQKHGNWTDKQRNDFANGWHEQFQYENELALQHKAKNEQAL